MSESVFENSCIIRDPLGDQSSQSIRQGANVSPRLDGNPPAFGPRGGQKHKPRPWKTLPTLSGPVPSGCSQSFRIPASTIHRENGRKTEVQDEQVSTQFL